MRKIIIKNIIAILVGILFIAGSTFSQQQQARDAEPIDGPIKKNVAKGAKLFESIEVETLNELHKLKVAVYLPDPARNTSTEDYKVSLNLGISVADAISSAVNKDKTKFLEYAKIIHDYGQRLDVEEAILGKYKEITDAVSQGQWKNVEKLIYDLKDAITAALNREDLDKKDEAVLAMVSGWLEGLYIVAKSLNKDFSEDAGKLLRNRDFVRYLSENLNTIDDDKKNKKEVKAMLDALPKIDEVINKPPDYIFTKDDAKRILKISEPLRKIIIM